MSNLILLFAHIGLVALCTGLLIFVIMLFKAYFSIADSLERIADALEQDDDADESEVVDGDER